MYSLERSLLSSSRIRRMWQHLLITLLRLLKVDHQLLPLQHLQLTKNKQHLLQLVHQLLLQLRELQQRAEAVFL